MSASRASRIALTAILAFCLTSGATPAGENQVSHSTALRTVEGTVVNVFSRPGEGNLQVVAVALDTGAREPDHLDLLLAPQQVLEEISFDLEKGDRLRARVFVSDQGALKVHKVMNLTRGTMVRFRSLRQVPLWDGTGDWEGGDCRRQGVHGGTHGPRGGGGGAGPRR